jgi:TonB-linked SusC/RagA family outer membrane protein
MGAIQVTASTTYAQGVRLNLNMKNVSIDKVFQEITKQSKLEFFFSNDDLNVKKTVSVNVSNGTVDEALHQILGNDYAYRIVDKLIMIEPAKKAPAKSSKDDGKDRTITGKVLDAKGLGLPGATVKLKGITSGVTTNANGEFKINVPANVKVLEISFIGFNQKDVVLDKKTNIEVMLEEATQAIDEVVVTGYQKINRKLFTGSAVKVNAKDAKVDGVMDVGQMLEGKAAGVSVQTVSGTFGAAPKIRVRGASSITGDQKPLWVIDGVVLEEVIDISPDDLSSGDAATLISSAVAGLNSEDIENFQILKDASATALYGARAMNGVIVITTKKGKSGITKVTYSGEYSMRLKPSYSSYNIMNSRDQMSVYRELEAKGWLNHAEISRQANGGIYKKMYDLINTYDPTTGQFGLENTPEARAKFLKKYEMINTDWFDVLFKNTLTQNHSVSLSGGSDKSSFYFSSSYYNDKGWSIADNVERYTVNANASINISPKVTLGFLTTGSFRQQRAPGTVGRVEDPINGEYTRDFDINPFSYALNTSRVLRPYDENGNLEYYRMNYAKFNIIDEMKKNYLDLSVLDLKIQTDLTYKIAKGLEFSSVGSVRYVKSTQEHKIMENSNMASAYRAADTYEIASNNKFLFNDLENPAALPYVALPKGGFYNRKDNSMLNFYFRNTLNWNKTFDEKHIVNVLLGQEIKSANKQECYFDGVGYQWNRGGVPYIDYNFIKQQLQGGYPYYGMEEFYDRFAAFFTTASYSYKGKYTINGTYRYDGSNRLGKSTSARWLPTWNVSGSWNVGSEPFMEKQELISHMVVRATHGLTASMGSASNSSLVLRSSITDRPYLSEKEGKMFIDALENSELTWEKQYETNVGMDLGILQNRINLSMDAYRRKGFDLIGSVKTSGIGGEFWKLANYADMKSHGIEFTLTTHNVQAKDFKWTTNLTFSYNKNEITNLKSMPNIYSLTRDTGGPLEGYPVRGLFSIQYKGLNAEGVPTIINEKGEKTIYDIDFQANNLEHLKYEGPIDPTITGGFGNAFSYKNWKLNVFMTYQAGNKVRLYPEFKARYSDLDAMPKEFFDRWTLAGDEAKTDIPTILSMAQYNVNYSKAYNGYNLSDARVVDGSFVRMKEISLSYDLPKSILKPIGLTDASLKVQGANLFLLYSDKKLNGQDPEFIGSGGVAMPVPKQFTFTLRIGL